MEQVLCIPTKSLSKAYHFEGFKASKALAEALIDSPALEFRPRDQVEHDYAYKQLIPYCVFLHQEYPGMCSKFLHYQRMKSSGEQRLAGKLSLGFGGHINADDECQGFSPRETYMHGRDREIFEELTIRSIAQEVNLGVINYDTDDVGKVHLGVVHFFMLERPLVDSVEPHAELLGFKHVDELVNRMPEFETWSQLIIKELDCDHYEEFQKDRLRLLGGTPCQSKDAKSAASQAGNGVNKDIATPT